MTQQPGCLQSVCQSKVHLYRIDITRGMKTHSCFTLMPQLINRKRINSRCKLHWFQSNEKDQSGFAFQWVLENILPLLCCEWVHDSVMLDVLVEAQTEFYYHLILLFLSCCFCWCYLPRKTKWRMKTNKLKTLSYKGRSIIITLTLVVIIHFIFLSTSRNTRDICKWDKRRSFSTREIHSNSKQRRERTIDLTPGEIF